MTEDSTRGGVSFGTLVITVLAVALELEVPDEALLRALKNFAGIDRRNPIAVEMQFRDGSSGKVIGECRDTEIGRKYASDLDSSAVGAAQTWASGYLNSFQSWSYAKDAFDKWAALIARRLADLRAEYGKADESVLDAAEEAGLLPWWVTALVLGGWALVILGIVLAVVGALT